MSHLDAVALILPIRGVPDEPFIAEGIFPSFSLDHVVLDVGHQVVEHFLVVGEAPVATTTALQPNLRYDPSARFSAMTPDTLPLSCRICSPRVLKKNSAPAAFAFSRLYPWILV